MRGAFVGFHIGAAGLIAYSAQAETNLLFRWIVLDDFEVMLLSNIQLDGNAGSIGGFRDVAEAFDALSQFHERAKLSNAQHLAMDHIADAVLIEEGIPDVGLQLLHAQRKAAVLRLDAKNNGTNLVALLYYFRRMLDALGPAHIANVD